MQSILSKAKNTETTLASLYTQLCNRHKQLNKKKKDGQDKKIYIFIIIYTNIQQNH
jgi:hypothetical protein